MEALYLLLPLGLAVVIAAGGAFVWAVHAGQFEDLDEAARAPPDDD